MINLIKCVEVDGHAVSVLISIICLKILRVLFIGLVLLLSWTGQKIAQVLTNNEPANAAFYF